MAVLNTVQNGSLTIGSGSTSGTASITAVDLTRAILVFGLRKTSGAEPRDDFFRGRFTSTTELTFERVTGGTQSTVIEWYVIEWSSGVTVQSGTTNGNANATITAVVLADTFLVFSYEKGGTIVGNDDGVTGFLSSTTQIDFDNDANSADPTCDWFVAESADFDVQAGSLTMTGTTADQSITAIDLTQAWPIISWEIDGNSGSDDFLIRGHFTSTTNLRCERGAAGPGDPGTNGIRWQVVEVTDGTTVQSGTFAFADADGQESATITAVVLADTSAHTAGFVNAGGESGYSADDQIPVSMVTLDLTSTTNLQGDRGDTNGAADVEWFVVEWATAAGVTITLVPATAASSAVVLIVSVARIIELAVATVASSAQVFTVTLGIVVTLATAVANAAAMVFNVVSLALRPLRRARHNREERANCPHWHEGS